MEIKTEVVNDLKQLTDNQKEELAQRLAKNFSKWDDDRNSQITTAKEIMDEVYLNQASRKKDADDWKSDVKLNGLYNIKRALTASLWREIWANPAQMFDVRGTNEQTEEQAKLQKAAIVDSLNKMQIGKQFDDAISNLFDIGEMIAKVDWEQKKKIVKRQKKDIGWVMQNIARNLTGAGYTAAPLTDVEIPLYENARVESISPFMFVFDHSRFKLRNKESWDSCIKIYKRFDTLDNIKANKVYDVKDEWIYDLNQDKENKTADNKEIADLRDEHQHGDMYSVMFAHGDFKINGKIYKNYVAEVLAGKYLIRFEENPMYINPFVFCALEFDPLTKRGIAKLKSVMKMCKEEEELTNNAFDAQKLTINPVLLAPEELFDEDNTDENGDIEYKPGKIIEYKSGLSANMPTPVVINSTGIADLLGLLNQKIADISSVSNVMYGNIESEKRTATELSLADKGSSAQAGKDLDTIYQDFNLPIVEKVAELLAMFKDGVDYVYYQEKGKNVEYRITNEIRQAQYNYVYEDRNALNDKKQKVQQLYEIFKSVGESPNLFPMIDWKEVIVTLVETVGYDNTDKFFAEESPAEQFSGQLKKLPPEIQQQIIPMFAQQLQQMQQQQQIRQQQAEMQAQAQKQVQMQQLRDNARAELEAQEDARARAIIENAFGGNV